MQDLSDEALVQQAQTLGSADGRYLDELFRRHYQKVSLWCLRYTGNREEAADLAQEVFLRAQRSIGSFQGASKFSTWLYTICRNHCLNRLQARAAESILVNGPAMLDSAVATDPETGVVIDRERMLSQARSWIREELDDTERKVFTLHYADDMPLDSITRLLGLTNTSGSKAFIVSARRKLQKAAERWRAGHETR